MKLLREYIKNLLESDYQRIRDESTRCTNATIRAIAHYFGDSDKVPDDVCSGHTTNIDTYMHLTRELGYKAVNITRWWQRAAMEGWRPTLKKFIADHPVGAYYLSSRGHAMALIDGELIDTAEFKRLGNVILVSGEKIEK